MKPFTLSARIFVCATIAIALLVGAWLIHRDGIKVGEVNTKLETTGKAIALNNADVAMKTKKDAVAQKAADTAIKRSAVSRTTYHQARAKVVLRGDTVITDGQSIELPSVADLVRAADSRGVTDSATIQTVAAADTSSRIVGSALRVGVSIREERNDVLEKAKRPWCSAKCGVAIGVGATVVVVVIAVKILNATGHK